MDRAVELSLEAARDTSKQIITLATSIVIVMVTFSKDFIQKAEPAIQVCIFVVWLIFILSILMGILTLMALTGKFDHSRKGKPSFSEITLTGKSNYSQTGKLHPPVWNGDTTRVGMDHWAVVSIPIFRIWDNDVIWPAGLQITLFLLGLLFASIIAAFFLPMAADKPLLWQVQHHLMWFLSPFLP